MTTRFMAEFNTWFDAQFPEQREIRSFFRTSRADLERLISDGMTAQAELRFRQKRADQRESALKAWRDASRMVEEEK